MRSVQASKIYHLDHGYGAETALFLHGFPMDHRLWCAQLSRLSPDMRCIAPDMPGFGKSPLPASGEMTVFGQADAIAGLMRLLDCGAVHVIGTSFGGLVALAFAIRHPLLTKSLAVFHSEASGDSLQARTRRDLQIHQVRDQGPSAFADAFSRIALAGGETTEAQIFLSRIMADTSAETMVRGLRCLRDRPDLRPALKHITAPSLFVAGENDPNSPPASMEACARSVPGARYLMLPDTGHCSILHRPDDVTAIIRAWVLSKEVVKGEKLAPRDFGEDR